MWVFLHVNSPRERLSSSMQMTCIRSGVYFCSYRMKRAYVEIFYEVSDIILTSWFLYSAIFYLQEFQLFNFVFYDNVTMIPFSSSVVLSGTLLSCEFKVISLVMYDAHFCRKCCKYTQKNYQRWIMLLIPASNRCSSKDAYQMGKILSVLYLLIAWLKLHCELNSHHSMYFKAAYCSVLLPQECFWPNSTVYELYKFTKC